MSGDRLSSHVPTCFRVHHKRVDPRHGVLTDTGFHPMLLVPRMRRDATCQRGWVRNLHSRPHTSFENSEVAARNFLYAPMRRNSNVVSGFMTSPFISSSGYTRKLIGPLSGSGSTTRSRPFVISKR